MGFSQPFSRQHNGDKSQGTLCPAFCGTGESRDDLDTRRIKMALPVVTQHKYFVWLVRMRVMVQEERILRNKIVPSG